VIQSSEKRATPARMYMDGVDFMPASRNVLFGYHFKSIAAAGPIVGVITAANLWGWLPALVWLVIGVSFIGWASDYSAIMVSVRNEGNSLSAISHRLIAPRTRTILFTFIFFYLLLIAGAFMGIMAALMDARPDVPFGIIVLALMGLLAGQMLYRWKMDLIVVTLIVVVVTVAAMILGPVGSTVKLDAAGKPVGTAWTGPVNGATVAFNTFVNRLSGQQPVMKVVDPTNSDPRLSNPTLFDKATGMINTLPSYLFWALFLLAFAYVSSTLPIWRFAQPVNYIGFWITLLTIGFSAIGAVLAPFLVPSIGNFALPAFCGPADVTAKLCQAAGGGFRPLASGAFQPLWPMLFVTIACGAISGWHALFGSVGTARQLEYETDALPVGGGAMFAENTLALLSLVAVSIAGTGGGAGRFAAGVGSLLSVIFGKASIPFGTALGFGAFMVIVLTVTQLIFRVMRVTLTEWAGDTLPVFRNMHVSTLFSMVLTMALDLTGTWVYLWQLFGAANQLMAALSLLIVTVWLKSTNRNPAFVLWPTLFMYVTTMASILVTAYNLYVTIVIKAGMTALPVAGAWAMIIISALLFVASLFIGWDGFKAYQRYASGSQPRPVPQPGD
ncbi:MAG TPA: carbon starvation CstA family protein, partial [Anaerolineaceae bacterium]